MDKTSHIFPKPWTKTLMFRGTQVFEFGHPRAIALRKAALVENFHIHYFGVSQNIGRPQKNQLEITGIGFIPMEILVGGFNPFERY